MIKNKDKHVKGRIITSILWKYIIFSIVFLAFLIFLLFTATWNSSEYKDIPQIKEVAEAFAHTQPESYKDVDIEANPGRKQLCSDFRQGKPDSLLQQRNPCE